MIELLIGAILTIIAYFIGRNYFRKGPAEKKAEYEAKDAELKDAQDKEMSKVADLEARIKKVRARIKNESSDQVDDYFNNKYGKDD